jgi:hypothetical protein
MGNDPLPPPHDIPDINAKRIAGARKGLRGRLHSRSRLKPRTMGVHSQGIARGGTAPLVVVAVVDTCTVAVCVPLPLICTEAGRVQVGARATAGLMLQLKFTVSANDPMGVKATLKLAVCPAVMVREAGAPEAGPMVKSGVRLVNALSATLVVAPIAVVSIQFCPSGLMKLCPGLTAGALDIGMGQLYPGVVNPGVVNSSSTVNCCPLVSATGVGSSTV